MFDKEAERREKFVQTYIILFGLLLANKEHYSEIIMYFFVIFLISIIFYITHLTTRRTKYIELWGIRNYVRVTNCISFIPALCLSLTISFYFQNTSSYSGYGIFFLFVVLLGILWHSLFISKNMLNEYLPDNSL